MDETIGSKGGRNDRRRTTIITKKQKEKLKKQKEEDLKELEKKVKQIQKYTLIKTIPIVILGETFKELTKQKEEKEELIVIDKEDKKEEVKTKKVTIVLKDGTKQIIEVPIEKELSKEKIDGFIKEKKQEETIKKDYEKQKIEEKPKLKPIEEKHPIEQKQVEEKYPIEQKQVEEKPKTILKVEKKKEEKASEKQKSIPILKTKEEKETTIKGFETLTENQKKKLQKLQARKIIDVYEKQLKDIRYELRNLIIEYNTLVDEEDKIIKSKEEEKILDKLNQIIKKIEELKNKIRIDDLDKYDDNYIYTLIEGYLEDFKDKKIIKEIKDSPLYILISEKLDEFDKRKEEFKGKIEDKKETLEIKEEKLEELKEKYNKIEKINKIINDFYREQEQILKEMQYKVDNATTVTEKVDVKVEYINKETTSLLKRLSLLMFIPGPKGAKALATMSSIYAMMARNMIRPKTITKRYKEVTVYDYSKDIKSNIKTIEEATNDLSKSSKNIDKLINQIKEEFSEYIGVVPECDELLSNLKRVKSNIEEKEYELEKIKSKQERELERNNAKVRSIGTY